MSIISLPCRAGAVNDGALHYTSSHKARPVRGKDLAGSIRARRHRIIEWRLDIGQRCEREACHGARGFGEHHLRTWWGMRWGRRHAGRTL